MNVLKEMTTEREPEFVKDAEGAKLARMEVNTFRKLANEFGAVYRSGKIRVTDWEILFLCQMWKKKKRNGLYGNICRKDR